MRVRVIVSVLVVVAGFLMLVGAPVAAQDDGGDQPDVAALVERLVWAEQASLAWTSFTSHTTHTSGLSLEVALMRQSQAVQVNVAADRTAQVVRQDGVPNVDAHISGTIGETIGVGVGGYRTYTVEADARWVEGVLYVNAQYTTARTDLPELANGWAQIDDPGENEVFAQLPLDDFSQGYWIFDDPDLLTRAVTSAAVTADTLDDGTPVDRITLVIDGAGLDVLFAEAALDPVLGGSYAILNGHLAAGSMITVGVALDQVGTLRGYTIAIDLQTGWMDATEFTDEYAGGAQMQLAVSLAGDQVFSAINEPLSPVTAPEMRGY